MVMTLVKFAIVTLCLLSSASSQTVNTQNIESGYDFSWVVNEAKGTITFTMAVKTTGWVGFGFGSKMPNTDIYMGHVATDGSAFAYDMYATISALPSKDVDIGGKSDITGITGSEVGGLTTITFTRPLNTGDSKDYQIEKDVPKIMAFASGSSDNYTQHGKQPVTKTLTLWASASVTPPSTTPPSTTPPSTTPPKSSAGFLEMIFALFFLSIILA